MDNYKNSENDARDDNPRPVMESPFDALPADHLSNDGTMSVPPNSSSDNLLPSYRDTPPHTLIIND